MQVQPIIAQVIAKIQTTIECELSGSCRFAARDMTKSLLALGVEDFTIVEGYVRQPGNRHNEQHTWVEVGKMKLDPTFAQFAEGTQYVGVKKHYTPAEYLVPNKKDAEFERKFPHYRTQYYQKHTTPSIS